MYSYTKNDIKIIFEEPSNEHCSSFTMLWIYLATLLTFYHFIFVKNNWKIIYLIQVFERVFE